MNLQPQTEYEEVAQNIQMIITTLKGEVPLDREFGFDKRLVDRPISAAQAIMTRDIIVAVKKYEPRAKIISVDYEVEGEKLIPRVQFKLSAVSD